MLGMHNEGSAPDGTLKGQPSNSSEWLQEQGEKVKGLTGWLWQHQLVEAALQRLCIDWSLKLKTDWDLFGRLKAEDSLGSLWQTGS